MSSLICYQGVAFGENRREKWEKKLGDLSDLGRRRNVQGFRNGRPSKIKMEDNIYILTKKIDHPGIATHF